jgi:hypothetical protein
MHFHQCVSSAFAMSRQHDASDDGGIPAAEAPAKRPPLNKYALACAVLASMNSILLGYGTCTHDAYNSMHSLPYAHHVRVQPIYYSLYSGSNPPFSVCMYVCMQMGR